jgi:prepilin-type N-terminal cleavage/methylation domain-containing protein
MRQWFRMEGKKSGFTLIELLMVIAIVGILAAVALPLYGGHTTLAKLAEVENAMSTVASSVEAYYHTENAWPNCPTVNEIRNSLGVSLGSIARIQAIGVSGMNGNISATIQNIQSMVDGKSLTLLPTSMGDGSLTWTWGWSADFPPQFRPKSGR